MKKYDVFISYARKDYVDENNNVIPGNVVSEVKDTLRQEGISFWIDEEGILCTPNWREEIVKNIRNSTVFVFLSTTNSNQSEMTDTEIAIACEFDKPIIPVRIDDSSFSDSGMFNMGKAQHILYYKNPIKGLEMLVQYINNELNKGKNKHNKTISNDEIDDDFEIAEKLFEAKDYNDSILYYLASAEKGNKIARNKICQIFYDNRAIVDGLSEAVWQKIEELSKQKESYVYFLLHCRYYYDPLKIKLSFEHVKNATQDTDIPLAFLRLGVHYKWGLGTKQNPILALHYYLKSLELDCKEACGFIGQIYEYGSSKTPKDLEKAIKYYKKGAELRDARSMRNLARTFFEQNRIEEARLTAKSMIDNGFFYGYILMGDFFAFNSDYSWNSSDNIAKAKEWYKEALLHDENEAYGSLSAICWYIEKKYDEAKQLANKGYLKHDSLSTGRLADFNFYENNYDEAWNLYMERYNTYGVGQEQLGNMFFNCDFRKKDKEEEKQLEESLEMALRVGANQGNLESLKYLMRLHALQESGKDIYNFDLIRRCSRIQEDVQIGAKMEFHEMVFYYGKLLLEENYKDFNPVKGIQFIHKAAAEGYADALSFLIENDRFNPNNDNGKDIIELNDSKEANAQYQLGNDYYLGQNGKEEDEEQAVICYTKSAYRGNVEALFHLGDCYYYGHGVSKDYEKAVKLYEKAAEKNYASAQNRLGDCYYTGRGTGVEPDFKEAVKWYVRAAEQGNAYAQYSLGYSYYYGKGVDQDYMKAVEWFIKAASQNNTDAQFRLGICYYFGKGVEQNLEEAVKWFSQAANNNNSDAQYLLGHCYYYGEGVDQDFEAAVNWCNKAVDQNNSGAQYLLGNCYYYGHGVSEDYEKAVKLYEKAAEQDNEDAQYLLGNCYYYGHGVSKDYEKAVKLYEKAAEQDNEDAQYSLGFCYYYGRVKARDLKKAVEWFTKSAEQDVAEAQYFLGRCYYYGEGVDQDYDKAIEWLKKSSDQGDVKAQCFLGKCYETVQKYQEAMYWYEKSAEEGCAEAQFLLGRYYYEGKVVPQNFERALKWIELAATQDFEQAQLLMGLCYLEGKMVEKDLSQAMQWLRRAISKDDGEIFFKLGELYYKGGWMVKDWSKALYWYEKAASQGKENARDFLKVSKYSYYKGVDAFMKQDIDEAIRLFEDALDDTPLYFSACNYFLGISYEARGDRNPSKTNIDYDRSFRCLNRALQAFVSNLGKDELDTANCREHLGSVLFKQGKYKEAKDNYNEALRVKEIILGSDHEEVVTLRDKVKETEDLMPYI